MSMSDKYDEFYSSSQVKEPLCALSVRRWPRNRAEAIIAVEGSGDSILDIGCGNGHLLYQFANRFSKLVGLELSKGRLSQAAINLADFDFVPYLGSAENMHSIESDSIDRIVSADTIEHIPDLYAATSEMCRVLKPGGIVVINTPNIAFIKKRITLLLGYFPATSQRNEGLGGDVLFDGGHFHYLTFRSLSLLLVRAGFRIEKKIGYGPLGRLHNIWPELLSGGAEVVAVKPEH